MFKCLESLDGLESLEKGQPENNLRELAELAACE